MNKKKILIAVLIVAACAAAIGFYLYNKPARTAEDEKPAVTMDAAALYDAFEADEQKANADYLDKVIQVEGTVNSVTEEAGNAVVYLATNSDIGAVSCTLSPGNKTTLKKGDKARIKGICRGYLSDVVLEQSAIIE